MFKVNNKDTCIVNFEHICSSVSIVNFEFEKQKPKCKIVIAKQLPLI